MSHPYLSYLEQDDFPLNPNLTFEHLEPHLDEITSFWAAGKLEELVQYIKKHLDQGICDIRLLSFYFYSLWEVDTFECSLDQSLVAFQNLLKQPDSIWLLREEGDKHEASNDDRPKSGALDEVSSQQLQKCITLFFNRVLQRLERFAENHDYEEPQPCEIIIQIEQFSDLLEQSFKLYELLPLVQEVSSYFQDTCQKAKEEAAQLEAIELAEIAEELSENNQEEAQIEQQPKETIVEELEHTNKELMPTEQVNNDEVTTANQTLEYALPMQQLLNKIQIFEILMQESNVYKAAIVFESIQKELQQFDPLHYLPELFSGYAKTHALYATELYQLMHQHENAQSQALKDYFAIDPEGFMQLEIDEETDLGMNQPHDYHEEY